MSEEEIHKICIEYNITNYTINTDGSIDVNGNVELSHNNLNKIPLQFRNVSGFFDVYKNNLTSLKGSPIKCGYFYCSRNLLTSLEYGPKEVRFEYDCYHNLLKTLKHSPISFEMLSAFSNPLESIEGYNGTLDKLDIDDKKKLVRKYKLNSLIKKI